MQDKQNRNYKINVSFDSTRNNTYWKIPPS